MGGKASYLFVAHKMEDSGVAADSFPQVLTQYPNSA